MAEQDQDRIVEARRQVHLFQELLEHPAWVELRKVAEAQVANRRNQYFRGPLKEGQTVNQQQWELGEASGIETFLRLPEILLETGRAIIEEYVNATKVDSAESGGE